MIRPKPKVLIIVVLCLICYFADGRVNILLSQKGKERSESKNKRDYFNAPIREEDGYELYQNWMNSAVSSLISAVAHKRLKNESEESLEEFGRCAKNAASVPEQAKCLSVLLIRQRDARKNDVSRGGPPSKTEVDIDRGKIRLATILKRNTTVVTRHKMIYNRDNPAKMIKSSTSKFDRYRRKFAIPKTYSPWIGKFRVSNKAAISLKSEKDRQNQLAEINGRVTMIGPRRNWNKSNYAIVRYKRHVRLQDESKRSYSLLTPDTAVGPLGRVAKMLMTAVLAAKNKTDVNQWQTTIDRIRRLSVKQKESQQTLSEEILFDRDPEKHSRQLADATSRGVFAERRKYGRFSEDVTRHPRYDRVQQRISGLVRQGLKLGYLLSGGRNASDFDKKNIRVISPRFLSVSPTSGSRNSQSGIDYAKNSVENHARSALFDQSSNDTIDILSPSLFGLYDDEKTYYNNDVGNRHKTNEINHSNSADALVNLPQLLNKVSGGADQQHWLNLIVEAAGINDQAELLEQMNGTTLSESFHVGSAPAARAFHSSTLLPAMSPNVTRMTNSGRPLYFTKENATRILGDVERRKVDTYQELLTSFEMDQWLELNTTGFSVLNRRQIQHLYGADSPYNCSDALRRLGSMSRSEVLDGLETDIHRLSASDGFTLKRQRDIVLSPLVNMPIVLSSALASQPVVLSPVVLSPLILSPAVLGPVILSPWLFVPLIISPRLLSPLILSPFALSPVILTPIALHPVILSPGVFIPIVLSPFLLAPLILNPLVFSPVILTPLALSPLILTPTVGSPLILSPFVLSPIILSPQILSALVLSPYALSPIIASPLIEFSVILSPSWLS